MNYSEQVLRDLLLIRNVEQAFLDLFSMGKLNGTVHTCIGQELSALAFAGQLNTSDFVFSNHRCHGHFISYTNNWKNLILELLGKKEGVCAGIGSSQHLHMNNFFSNGIQGGILPVSAGYAYANKLKKNDSIGIVFIGDGTLGEGVVYETLNFISKKKIPLLVVCENNQYAQSTPLGDSLAGSIKDRALAFGIEFFESSTFGDQMEILTEAKVSIDFVRENKCPAFHLVNTYRLKAHSKGDDNRDILEIEMYEGMDPLNIIALNDKDNYDKINRSIHSEVWEFINECFDKEEISLNEYYEEQKTNEMISYDKLPISVNRQINDLNEVFIDLMDDEKTVFLGEDILDPYGGAFKVTKGLSDKNSDRVIGTSISELLIAGVANGLALNGYKPYAEFMFGDFTALAFDQLLNHASKFYNMYNKQIKCPVVFRTPMGGKRGYGPTHSQSIEKHFVGMDTFEIVCLNIFLNPRAIYQYVHNREHPTLVIENKVDYGKKAPVNVPDGYELLISNESIPNIVIKPIGSNNITTTIITYGGTSEMIYENIESLFVNHDELVQVLILSKIDPLPEQFILDNIKENTNVITLEEGSCRGSIGDNIISFIAQNKKMNNYKTISSLDISIPSSKGLEEKVLVNVEVVLNCINSFKYEINR